MLTTLFLMFLLPPTPQQPTPRQSLATYNDCYDIGGSANADGYETQSIRYQCRQGVIELKGHWRIVVEYGTVYRTRLGGIDGTPEPATQFDRTFWKWCRLDDRQIAAYDLTPYRKGDEKKPIDSTAWYPYPKSYPACPSTFHVYPPRWHTK